MPSREKYSSRRQKDSSPGSRAKSSKPAEVKKQQTRQVDSEDGSGTVDDFDSKKGDEGGCFSNQAGSERKPVDENQTVEENQHQEGPAEDAAAKTIQGAFRSKKEARLAAKQAAEQKKKENEAAAKIQEAFRKRDAAKIRAVYSYARQHKEFFKPAKEGGSRWRVINQSFRQAVKVTHAAEKVVDVFTKTVHEERFQNEVVVAVMDGNWNDVLVCVKEACEPDAPEISFLGPEMRSCLWQKAVDLLKQNGNIIDRMVGLENIIDAGNDSAIEIDRHLETSLRMTEQFAMEAGVLLDVVGLQGWGQVPLCPPRNHQMHRMKKAKLEDGLLSCDVCEKPVTVNYYWNCAECSGNSGSYIACSLCTGDPPATSHEGQDGTSKPATSSRWSWAVSEAFKVMYKSPVELNANWSRTVKKAATTLEKLADKNKKDYDALMRVVAWKKRVLEHKNAFQKRMDKLHADLDKSHKELQEQLGLQPNDPKEYEEDVNQPENHEEEKEQQEQKRPKYKKKPSLKRSLTTPSRSSSTCQAGTLQTETMVNSEVSADPKETIGPWETCTPSSASSPRKKSMMRHGMTSQLGGTHTDRGSLVSFKEDEGQKDASEDFEVAVGVRAVVEVAVDQDEPEDDLDNGNLQSLPPSRTSCLPRKEDPQIIEMQEDDLEEPEPEEPEVIGWTDLRSGEIILVDAMRLAVPRRTAVPSGYHRIISALKQRYPNAAVTPIENVILQQSWEKADFSTRSPRAGSPGPFHQRGEPVRRRVQSAGRFRPRSAVVGGWQRETSPDPAHRAGFAAASGPVSTSGHGVHIPLPLLPNAVTHELSSATLPLPQRPRTAGKQRRGLGLVGASVPRMSEANMGTVNLQDKFGRAVRPSSAKHGWGERKPSKKKLLVA